MSARHPEGNRKMRRAIARLEMRRLGFFAITPKEKQAAFREPGSLKAR